MELMKKKGRHTKNEHYNKTKNDVKLKFNFMFIVMLLIPCLLIGVAYSKYSKENKTIAEYSAGNFYFESDLLTNNPVTKIYTYRRGQDYISIILKNNADELRFSEVNVQYRVKITDTNGNSVNNKNGSVIGEKVRYFKKYRN